MEQNTNPMHRCRNCAHLNETQTRRDGYGGAEYCWCVAFGCFVAKNGTCVKERNDNG